MKRFFGVFISIIFILSLFSPILFTLQVKATDSNPLDYFVSYNFENASNDGFTARGQSTTVSSVYDVAYEGFSSLKIQNRISVWDGCEIDKTNQLSSGINYQVSTYVYHTSSQPQPFKIIALIQDENGERYQTIAETIAIPNYWKNVFGNLNFSVTGTLRKLSIFIVSQSDTSFPFYIDKFEIAGPNKVGKPGLIVSSTFESNTVEGWQPRGNGVSINLNNSISHTGNYSLYVQGRTSNWHGAQIDLKNILQKGKTYTISGWVYQNTGSEQKITLTMQNQYDGGNTNYTSIKYSQSVPSDTWVELSGTFTVSSTANVINNLTLYFESSNTTLSFYIDDINIIDQNAVLFAPEWEIPSLFECYSNYFKIGVAIPYKVLTNSTERQMVLKHFNSITAENEMKQDAIQTTEGNFNFSIADEYVRFAQENNKVIRGHTLVWHQQVPNWFFYQADGTTYVSKEELYNRLKTHIETVVSRYQGKVYAWDVVNEAIDPSQSDGYRRSHYFNIAGPEYIEKAFIYAHEADPNAKLFYNDYNTEDPKKRQFIYEMVKSLKEKGIPINGIGMQCHINIDSPSISEIEKTIQLFSSIPGIEIHITELDVNVYTDNSTSFSNPPSDLMVKLAYRYKDLFDLFKKYKNVVTNVTLWGLKDDYSWLNSSRNNFPLLFDKNYQSKYAFWALVEPNVIPPLIQKITINNGQAIIDGKEDNTYKTVKPIKIFSEQNEIASSKILWDNDNLNIFMRVNDNTKDSSDQIYLYIDQNNAKSPNLQPDDIIINLKRNGEKSCNIEGVINNAVINEDNQGYIIEISVKLPNILPVVNSQIGFDISIVDNQLVYNWNDTTSKQLLETSKYGIIVYGDKVKIACAKKGTPAIDGEEDEIFKDSEEIITNTVVNGSVNGAYAKVKTLWDENKIYVFAKVYDPLLNSDNANAWEQDSLEIFIDENNEKSSSYQDDDAQYRVNYNNVKSYGTGALFDKFDTVTKIIYNDGNVEGYIVEAAVYAKTIKLYGDLLIGFDVQVNDADNTGKRVNVLTWSDPIGNDYRDTSRFGCLLLSNENTKSISTNLKSLQISAGSLSPAFNPEITNYNVTVANNISSILITPVVEDKNANITVNNGSPSQMVLLNVGDNVVTIKVTAFDNSFKIYTININRQNSANSGTTSSGTGQTTSSISSTISNNNSQMQQKQEQNTNEPDNKQTSTNNKEELLVDLKKGVTNAISSKELNIVTIPNVVQLIIPKEAVLSNGIIMINEIPIDKIDNLNIASKPIEITTTAKIKGNIEIKFEIDKNLISEDNIPIVLKQKNDKWQIVRTKVVINEVTAISDGGGKYIVAVDKAENIFEDIKSHWSKDAITKLLTNGIITGYENKTFKPNEKINLNELIVILSRTLNWEGTENENSLNINLPAWAKDALINAFNKGIINNEMLKDSSKKLTRLEAIELIVKATENLLPKIENNKLEFSDIKDISNDKLLSIEKAISLGLISGYSDNTFRPNAPISRAEVCAIISRLLSSTSK
ncbi:endo-1,4-beta-xylanase [Caldicellulosiruptoraceae bacterium PP1]